MAQKDQQAEKPVKASGSSVAEEERKPQADILPSALSDPAKNQTEPALKKPALDRAISDMQHQETGLLNGEIEVLPDKRLPHLDQGPVKAYAARVKGDVSVPYFAMVCEPHLVPRARLGPSYASLMNPSLVRLVASGTMYWPKVKENRYCFIYENTLGEPLMKADVTQGLGWRHDRVMEAVIKPMVNLLLDMRDAGIVHGQIRPSNLFVNTDQVGDRLVLGECLSTPTGYNQPIIFETVERALCDPIARGKGLPDIDLYAFGVTLTFILGKRDHLSNKSAREIVVDKIKYGSYSALTGNDRFTGAILELLRGLLYDDAAQRWTLDEVVSWVDGQRLSPKQSSKKKKATRPLVFNGKRYFQLSLLAKDLNENQAEAVQLIDNQQIEQWINRSLEDPVAENRLEAAIERAQEYGRGPGFWDRLLSRVSIALDPEAPIRFKDQKFHPEGIATALAEAVVLKKDLQPFADIFDQQLVMDWINVQTNMRVDVGALVNRNDSCRTFLRQKNIGYGIERCLYFLDPEIPCLSPEVQHYYARTPEDLMYAFEDLSSSPKKPHLFIDRHVAAFLSVRDRKTIDAYLSDLNSEEFPRRILGNLMVLATIQKRERMEPFPGITRWISDILDPVYNRYHDRELRASLKESVSKLKDSGRITKIAALFDSNSVLQKDFTDYKNAMKTFQELRKEKKELEDKLQTPEIIGKETGKEVAAIVSGFIAGIVILGLSFMYFLN